MPSTATRRASRRRPSKRSSSSSIRLSCQSSPMLRPSASARTPAKPECSSAEHILRRARRPPRSVVEAASMAHTVTAARGTALSCKGWVQEAALRMLCNNLDPEVAEKPDELIVYGGSGKAARDWPSFDRICATLKTLADDETLLVQSGKPVGVLRTHPDAPRVLIANSNLVPKWATWEKFRELEHAGLTMYGQMTAGSWIYIGTQGILQGTYETFAAAGRQHFGSDDLAGRLIVSAGLGGMGGAQPLAAAMCGATFLGVEVDPARARRRLEQGYLDYLAPSLDEALVEVARCIENGWGKSIGVVGNAAEILPELVRRKIKPPDLLTDQTSA